MHKSNGDLKARLQSEKHHKAVRGAVASTKTTNHFATVRSKCEDEITAAKGTLAFHAVRHHYSFLSMDCTSVLLKKIFPDPNVAKKFSSGPTKKKFLLAYLRNILLMLFGKVLKKTISRVSA